MPKEVLKFKVSREIADKAAAINLRSGLWVQDDQDPLGFLISQTAYIEPQVYEVRYADIQYPMLVPVDTAASEWARTITYFSMDKVGQAAWYSGVGKDIPLAETWRNKHDVTIEMGAIGYRYTMEEVAQAMMAGVPLQADRAMAARRAAEEYIDSIVLNGDATKSMDGLLNHSSITKTDAATKAGGATTEWVDASADEIITDVNSILGNLWDASKTVEMANTLLLPPSAFFLIAGMPRASGSDMTVLEWVRRANLFTATTGMELMIRVCRGLENAAATNHGRAVAYRRDPEVLKLHLPMPHRFLPVWHTAPLVYDVPGIFRTAGLEIRRPGAMRYLDLITT